MPFYKNNQNKIYFLDDAKDAHFLPAGCVSITDKEADILIARPPSAQQQRDAIQAQIDALERAQLMPRVTREALLGIALQQGNALGMTEPQMYAANIGYRKLKDFEASIVALRDQMGAIK